MRSEILKAAVFAAHAEYAQAIEKSNPFRQPGMAVRPGTASAVRAKVGRLQYDQRRPLSRTKLSRKANADIMQHKLRQLRYMPMGAASDPARGGNW